MTIGKMDCTVLKNECAAAEVRKVFANALRSALTRRRVQIRGYPTIKAFYNGRELSTHQARSVFSAIVGCALFLTRLLRARAGAARAGAAEGLCGVVAALRRQVRRRSTSTRILCRMDMTKAAKRCYGYTVAAGVACVTRRAAAAAAPSRPSHLRGRHNTRRLSKRATGKAVSSVHCAAARGAVARACELAHAREARRLGRSALRLRGRA